MIDFKEAQNLIIEQAPVNEAELVSLEKASGKILAEAVIAPIHLPPFPQSAMDGFAIRHADFSEEGQQEFKVISEVKAGDIPEQPLQRMEAVRIFTGAQIPEGADTVVMQEHVNQMEGTIAIHSNGQKPGANIRQKGEQIQAGQEALAKGTLLTPPAIGFLASMGITEVPVIQHPRVGIVVTGNEVIAPGNPLQSGQVYECNSFGLEAALKALGIREIYKTTAKDDYRVTYDTIAEMLEKVDVLLVTGGISVGKYDLVKDVFETLGIRECFYKVAQKPGKPLYAGKNPEEKLVFGLPGNPGAVLSCFYEYVYPVIRKQQGFQNPWLPSEYRKLLDSANKKQGRSYLLKGKLNQNGVEPLDGQASFMLKAFAEADCLIYIPAEREGDLTNEWVEVHKLPLKN